MHFAVEGIVGAGKSTMLEVLTPELPMRAVIKKEPLDQFVTFDASDINPLAQMYLDPFRNSFVGQLHIMDVVLKQHYTMFNKTKLKKGEILITERSALSPLVFIEAYSREGCINDFERAYLLKHFTDNFIVDMKPDFIILMDTDYFQALQRMRDRKRDGESTSDSSFHQTLHEVYSTFFTEWNIPVCNVPKSVCEQSPDIVAKFVGDFIRHEAEKAV